MCAYPKDLEESAANHGEFRPPRYWVHNNRRHVIRIVPPVPGLWLCCVHADCICNEVVSARNRVLGQVPKPTVAGLASLRSESRRLALKVGTRAPWEIERVLESFTGPRKAKYQEAYESTLTNPVSAGDGRIQAFVKAEKFDPDAKVNPDPRMIQARSPRYNLVIAKYLRPTEHIIYNLVGRDKLREVAKGMNQFERAATILRKFSLFKSPVCFSVDCSRWDKHVSRDVLLVEHGFYKAVVGYHPEFDRLLSCQLNNRCRTSGGVKYTVDGGRMSGDINTALGNCLLMVLMARSAMRMLGVDVYSIFDDGDDCLIFVEDADFNTVSMGLNKTFLEFGQEIKIENVAREPWDVVFCQSRIVHNGEQYAMVRNWRKVLSQSACGTKHWNDPCQVAPMLGLVGTCELALSAGVPILQDYANALIRLAGGKIAKTINADSGVIARLRAEFGQGWESAITNARSRTITPEARASFERTFGVPDWEQQAIGNILANWSLSSFVAETVPVERDSTWVDTSALSQFIPLIY